MPVLTNPGVIQFVGIGKTPQPIEDHEIEALQQIIGTGSVVRPWPFLRERVRFDDAPLRNVEGILTRVGDTDQIVISVTLLQRSVAYKWTGLGSPRCGLGCANPANPPLEFCSN